MKLNILIKNYYKYYIYYIQKSQLNIAKFHACRILSKGTNMRYLSFSQHIIQSFFFIVI